MKRVRISGSGKRKIAQWCRPQPRKQRRPTLRAFLTAGVNGAYLVIPVDEIQKTDAVV